MIGDTTEAEDDARPLRESLEALGALGAQLACGLGAKITTHIALHMGHDQRGFSSQVREEVERVNRWLTMKSHTWRVRGESEPRPDWHIHGCEVCASGIPCTEDCKPGGIEKQQVGRLYEPRICEGCAAVRDQLSRDAAPPQQGAA